MKTNLFLTLLILSFVLGAGTVTGHENLVVFDNDDCSAPVRLDPGDCIMDTLSGAINWHDCGPGHEGRDRVYELFVLIPGVYTLVVEAPFDADFTLASTCDSVTGDILCEDVWGVHVDPSCGEIIHHDYGFLYWSGYLEAGTYYLWVDEYFPHKRTSEPLENQDWWVFLYWEFGYRPTTQVEWSECWTAEDYLANGEFPDPDEVFWLQPESWDEYWNLVDDRDRVEDLHYTIEFLFEGVGTPTMTPMVTPTETPEETPTVMPTATLTPEPTGLSTETPMPTDTPMVTMTPMVTGTSTDTPTPESTGTPVPTETPISTSTPPSTHTPVSTSTNSPTLTSTPLPTSTPTLAPTETPASTFTPTMIPTPTVTSTPEPTRTPLPTETPEPTFTSAPTDTPKPTSTSTPESTETSEPTETPTPTAISSATPVDTSTPSPTVTPGECPLGTYIEMDEYFSPGDCFDVDLHLCNPGEAMSDTPVFCVLELYASYWFWPSWECWYGQPIYENEHYIRMTVPHGEAFVPILEFVWPDTDPMAMSGINFLAGMTDPGIMEIIGWWDSATFGFGPAR